MTMLEKMAKAMHEYACTPYGAKGPMPESWRLHEWHYTHMARIALLTMRIPDGETVDALYGSEGDELNVWTDGIDHILGLKWDVNTNALVPIDQNKPAQEVGHPVDRELDAAPDLQPQTASIFSARPKP